MTQIITNTSTRRSFLRTATAGALSVPFLESTAQSRLVETKAPKRFIFMGAGYGFTWETFYPTKVGSFSRHGLPEGMKPLEAHKDDITVVSNLTNLCATDSHAGSDWYLSAAKNEVSCDQLAAQKFGRFTRHSSLILAGKETVRGARSGHGSRSKSLSWNHYGKCIPAIEDPLKLYHHLFTDKHGEKAKFEEALKKKKSMLDVLKLDAFSMNRKLSAVDRAKLDEYFQGIREIELSLKKLAQWADEPKPEPPFAIANHEKFARGEEETKLMFNLIIAALQTDMTRVVTYRLPLTTLLTSLGIETFVHSVSHYGVYKKFRGESQMRDLAAMRLFAHFIDRLKQAKDVDGSRLYDNCIVSYGSNLRTGHILKNLPAILTGGGAEKIKHGNHVKLEQKNTPLAQYWLTLLREGGIEVDRFAGETKVLPQLLSH